MALAPDQLLDEVEAMIAALPSEAHRQAARTQLAARQAQIEIEVNRERWLHDPVAWSRERVHVDPWSKQGEVLASVRDHKRTAVKSCNAAGKSFTAADVSSWWLDVHPPGTAFVVTTAPTFPQVRAILWREIRNLHRSGSLMGRVNQTEWVDDDGNLVAYGRKPADHDAVGFLGIHARYVLVVIDEACGVPKALWDATESIATNDDCRILAIGNPDDPGTEFAAVFTQPDLWHTITISAFDTPNLTGEPVSDDVRHKLVSERWVQDAALRWGIDSPLYISRVLAEFPIDASDRAVPFSDVMTKTIAVDPPYASKEELLRLGPVVLGLDVGEGSDYTVIRERRGPVAYRSWSALTVNPDEIADLALAAIVTTGARVLNYDAGGPGWAVGSLIRDRLKANNLQGVVLNPIQFGAKAREPLKYANRRAELVWGIGRLFSQDAAWYLGGMVDALTGKPNWEDTVAQLTDQKWHLNVGDRIVIESKDEIRKRTGRSPDDADALLLAYAQGTGEPATITTPQGTIPTGARAVTRPNARGAALPTRVSSFGR